MKRIEIQKDILRNKIKDEEPLVDERTVSFLSDITDEDSVIEFGGIGFVSEYLSKKGITVALCEENSLCFSYRKNILPDSKVDYINVNPLKFKFTKPVFDYIIINDLSFMSVARKLAKKAIINMVTEEYVKVVRSTDVVST